MKQEPRVSRKWAIAIAAAALVAFSLKTFIASTTLGTNDAAAWQRFSAYLQQFGSTALYSTFWQFNHPPFMVHMLRVWGWLAANTGVPFQFWLRLPGIVADGGSLVLTFRLLRREGWVSPPAVFLLALAPASVMISGFHGNTDPVMVFFVLLCIYWVETGQSLWLAGAALGMAINTKAAALMFVPAIVISLPSLRQRVYLIVAGCVTIGLGSMPPLLRAPVLIARRVAGYKSLSGHWGLSRVLHLLPSDLAWADLSFAHRGRFVLLAIIIVVSVYMNRRRPRPPLFFQCGLVVFLFLSVTPGFGVQYLAWLVPFAAIDLISALLFFTTSGVFLFLVYNYWSGGFPWYFADSEIKGEWSWPIIYFEVICWFATIIVCILYIHKFRKFSGKPGDLTQRATEATSICAVEFQEVASDRLSEIRENQNGS